MTEKEKATAYDEALERARKMLNMILDNELLGFPDQIREIFPQLRESEDERIRKELISLVRMHVLESDTCLVRGGKTTRKEAIAYLEKQKEQKPAEWDELQSEFKNINEAFEDGKKEVVAHPEKYDLCKPAEWSKNDTTFLNEITDFFENKTVRLQHDIDMYAHWLKYLPERFNLEPKQEWNTHDKAIVNCIVCCLDGQFVPEAARKQSLEWFNKHRRDFLNQPKQEWSEDDERIAKEIEEELWYPGDFPDYPSKEESELYDDCQRRLDWFKNKLKSIRPQPQKELSIEKAIKWLDDTFYFLDNSSGRGRDCEITTHDFDSLEEMYDSFRKAVTIDSQPHWKPSEEQMEALDNARFCKSYDRTELDSLYDQLKKL